MLENLDFRQFANSRQKMEQKLGRNVYLWKAVRAKGRCIIKTKRLRRNENLGSIIAKIGGAHLSARK